MNKKIRTFRFAQEPCFSRNSKWKKIIASTLAVLVSLPLITINFLSPTITKAAETDVSINEVFVNPSGLEPAGEWIELYNGGVTSVDLTSWKIECDECDPPNIFTFGSKSISAKDWLLIPYSESGLEVPNSNINIILKNAIGTIIDSMIWAGAISSNLSVARKPDGTGAPYEDSSPTPGDANNTPPETPTLILPPNGTITTNTVPAFDWTDSNDIDGDLVRYKILIDNSASFSSPVIDENLDTSTLTPVSALADGKYYWEVASYDEYEFGDFSDVWILTIDKTAPVSTVTTSGIFGPNTWPGSVNGTASDTSSGVEKVSVKIKNPDNITIIDTDAVGTISWSLGVASSILTKEGEYKIESTATDNAGNIEATGIGSFVWDSTPPINPSAPSASVVNYTIHLSWNLVSDADHYEIWRASSPYVLIATVPGNQNSYIDTNVEKGKTYKYRIIAVDLAGNKSAENGSVISIKVPGAVKFISTAQATKITPSAEIVAPTAEAEEITPPIEEGKILGDEEGKETRNWTPLIVIISLIILFGAGYYGYSWYSRKSGQDRW